MTSSAKKYKVTIFGDAYTLVSDESESHVTQSASKLDELMAELARHSGITDTKKLAILAALQIASQAQNFEAQVEQLKIFHQRLDALLSQGIDSLNEL